MGVTAARIGAAALSVALMALVLKLLDAAHPSAGATTMSASFGPLTSLFELFAIAGGILLLTPAALLVDRLLGVRHPRWR